MEETVARSSLSSVSGKVIAVGPTTEGKTTRYDAEAIKPHAPDLCVPWFVTKGLHNCPNGCPLPGHPDHQPGGKAHTYPEDAPPLKTFNMSRTAGKGKGKAASTAGKGGLKRIRPRLPSRLSSSDVSSPQI